MNKQNIVFFSLTILTVISISLVLSYHNSSSIPKVTMSNNVLYLKDEPVNMIFDGDDNLTSLITNTEHLGSLTMLHLVNGYNINTTNQGLTSGKSIWINVSKYHFECSLTLSSNSNTTISNNTSFIIQIYKTPQCEKSYSLTKVNSWGILNQK